MENITTCSKCKIHRYTFQAKGYETLVLEFCQLHKAASDLLEAAETAFERLKPKGDVQKDYSGHVAVSALSKAIAKAKEESK